MWGSLRLHQHLRKDGLRGRVLSSHGGSWSGSWAAAVPRGAAPHAMPLPSGASSRYVESWWRGSADGFRWRKSTSSANRPLLLCGVRHPENEAVVFLVQLPPRRGVSEAARAGPRRRPGSRPAGPLPHGRVARSLRARFPGRIAPGVDGAPQRTGFEGERAHQGTSGGRMYFRA
jgi:hypothetical protein